MVVKRVGVIGGGQLAWMMAEAAQALEIELIVQTPSSDDPAADVATEVILAAVDDATATAQLATRCEVITFENEFIHLEPLLPLAQQGVCFRPNLEALSPLLDKYQQRRYLRSIGLPVPQFIALESAEHPTAFEFPAVLKVRRHGYDGQGIFMIPSLEALETTWNRLQDTPVLLEEFVPFERELAAIAARSADGEIIVYPVVETQQEEQVCRRVIAPAAVSSEVVSQVNAIARTLLQQLQAVGVFAIELFLTPEGKVLVNEVAPRTHNSGHYTLDACKTSQFEMQLRTVAGLPLSSPALISPGAVMVNLLGYEYSEQDYREKRTAIAAIEQAHVHWYGKSESRPGRKLGHVTVLLDQQGQQHAQQTAQQIESIWYE